MQPEKSLIPGPQVVNSDVRAGVEIGRVFSGYFNSSEKAAAFYDMGIAHFVPVLPQHVRMADLGGGDGHLAAEIKGILNAQQKTTDVLVVDGNRNNLEKAKLRGLAILEADLAEVELTDMDLIISRAAFHYNPVTAQRRILERVREALTPDGLFVNQISSGDAYNVALRNEIAGLPSLGRATKGSVHFATPEEYIGLCIATGLETEQAGYAPSNSWTPEEMFDRFHPETAAMTEEDKKTYQPRAIFIRECRELIQDALANTDIQGVELTEDSAVVVYQYPIFVSRKSD